MVTLQDYCQLKINTERTIDLEELAIQVVGQMTVFLMKMTIYYFMVSHQISGRLNNSGFWFIQQTTLL